MTWEASRKAALADLGINKPPFPARAGLLQEHSLLPTLFSASRKGLLSETTTRWCLQ